MKILIVGAGAIGGSTAAFLNSAGADITVLETNAEACNIIASHGISVTIGSKTLSAFVKIVNSPSELKPKSFDYCLSCTRAYHLKAAVKSILPYLTDDALIVSMNNGVCIDALVEAAGIKRAVGCSINFGAGIISPGKYFIKIGGSLIMGMLTPKIPGKLVRLTELINKAVPCSVTDNIVGTLYSKMLINSCITSIAVLTGENLGTILKKRKGREIFTRVIEEGAAVAKAAGIYIPPYNKKLNYYKLVKNSLWAKLKRRIIYMYLGGKYKKRDSATLEAMKKGAKSETDFYNGYICSLGAKYNILTPVNCKICELVGKIEKGEISISPSNLYLF